MDWTKQIEHEQAEITRLETELAERELMLAAARARLAHARRVGSVAAPTESSARTDLIVGLLRAAPRPMSPKELLLELIPLDPGATQAKVRATLNHMKSQQRVQRVGRGQWTVPRSHQELS